MITKRTMLRRIEKAWNACNDSDKETGMVWYPKAFETASRIADDYALPIDSVVAVIANTSPRIQWNRNVTVTEIICAGGNPSGVFGTSIRKAIAALNSSNPVETVSGPKTEAFFQNIMGNSEPVTIDTWMLKVIGLTANDLTNANYPIIADAFRTYARRLALPPSAFQAIIWTYAKRTIKREPRKA